MESLKDLKEKLIDNVNEKNVEKFLNHILNNDVYMPMNVEMTPELSDMINSYLEGKKIKNLDKFNVTFDIVSDESKTYLPIFSSIEESGEDYASVHSWLSINLYNAILIYKGRNDVNGIVLDPFTKPYEFDNEMIDAIKKDYEDQM